MRNVFCVWIFSWCLVLLTHSQAYGKIGLGVGDLHRYIIWHQLVKTGTFSLSDNFDVLLKRVFDSFRSWSLRSVQGDCFGCDFSECSSS